MVMPTLIIYLNTNQHGVGGYFSNLLQIQYGTVAHIQNDS